MITLEDKQAEQTNHLREVKNDHDLVQELSKRLDAACTYAERIAQAEDDPELQAVWCDLEAQEQANIRRLKELICHRVDEGVFLNEM